MKMVRTVISAATATAKSDILNSKYEEAVKTLNTLQTNAQTLEKIRNERDKNAHLNIPNMLKFAERVGISEAAMDSLNVVHVSGTKGKGSTCAFCESILRSHGYRTGFYSSPHLVEVRERLRINGQPIHRDSFASYFWDVYTKLEESKGLYEGKMPNYFGFLTVMALHVFLQEKVDVAILEVGIGGQYDCTNLVKHPVVCGVSSLGLDHTSILGTTLDKIAWHKAGIFKPGVPAFTAPQHPTAMEVLKNRAKEIGVPLTVCPDLKGYDSKGRPLHLGIKGSMQQINASLALQLANQWISRVKDKDNKESSIGEDGDIKTAKPFQLSSHMIHGLEECSWLGRNQKICQSDITYYLDGAHTLESIQQCVEWFQGEMCLERKRRKKGSYNVLIFNTTGDRDTTALLEPLQVCNFDAVLFCPNVAFLSQNSADQNNRNVTKESQINRCLSNKHIWEKIIKTTSQQNVIQTISQQNIVDNQSVNGGQEPSSGISLHKRNLHSQETSQQTASKFVGDGKHVVSSRLEHMSANGISMKHFSGDTNSCVREKSRETNESLSIAVEGKVAPHIEDGPSEVKKQRVEKVVVNGHQFGIEKTETTDVDLNCNCNISLNSETDIIVNDDVVDNQTVIHAFPSISHCIEWIIQGKQLRDDSTQGKQLGESLEPVLYDANQGDLEDFDKTLPEIGDKHVNILVTGSLHLVGGALRVIDAENVCS